MPSDPYRELVSALEARMKRHADQAVSGTPSEFGTMTDTGLKLDSFKHEIRDYLVSEWLVKLHLPQFSLTGSQNGMKDSQGVNVSGVGVFDFQPVVIDEVVLEVRPMLKTGDRVLAVPVNGGQDAVVICKVVS